MPKNDPPKNLVAKTLIQGSGPEQASDGVRVSVPSEGEQNGSEREQNGSEG